jgi:excisionase family DNA binding protein
MPLSADGRPLISTSEACRRSGLTPGYLSLVARRGQIEAIRVGNYWLLYEDSFERFLAQPRKPGPKRGSGRSSKRASTIASMAGESGDERQVAATFGNLAGNAEHQP